MATEEEKNWTKDNRDQPTKTILVVDDDRSLCEFMDALLTRAGFNVVMEFDGESALKSLRSKEHGKIDLVLLDLMMPGNDGWTVLKELQTEEFQNIPIFIITARALDRGTVDLLLAESNVKEFFKKPIEYEEFLPKVFLTLGVVPKRKK